MKNSMVLTLLPLLAVPAAAQQATADAPGFSVKGDGSWELICHVVGRGEDQPGIVLSPRRSSYYSAALLHADCQSTATAPSDLAITISGAKKCPFKSASADACTTTIHKGRVVQFEFSANGTR